MAKIISKPATKESRDGWDRVYGEKVKVDTCEHVFEEVVGSTVVTTFNTYWRVACKYCGVQQYRKA